MLFRIHYSRATRRMTSDLPHSLPVEALEPYRGNFVAVHGRTPEQMAYHGLSPVELLGTITGTWPPPRVDTAWALKRLRERGLLEERTEILLRSGRPSPYPSALGHSFDSRLRCERCGTTHAQHRADPRPCPRRARAA